MGDEAEKDPEGGVSHASSPHQELMERVAGSVAPWCEAAIRQDERFRIAQLLSESRKALAGFAGSKEQLVDCVAFMLQMGGTDAN